MEDQRFKTMRHIETVRNYLNEIIRELLLRQEQHDQTKLQEPERSIFDKYTPLLRGVTYGSEEYKKMVKEMGPAVVHHQRSYRHHPEFFEINVCIICFKEYPIQNTPNNCERCMNGTFSPEKQGISGMNLIDLLEMICDWKASGMRHADGDIYKSIEINKKRFGYSDELAKILKNTADWLNSQKVFNRAEES